MLLSAVEMGDVKAVDGGQSVSHVVHCHACHDAVAAAAWIWLPTPFSDATRYGFRSARHGAVYGAHSIKTDMIINNVVRLSAGCVWIGGGDPLSHWVPH